MRGSQKCVSQLFFLFRLKFGVDVMSVVSAILIFGSTGKGYRIACMHTSQPALALAMLDT